MKTATTKTANKLDITQRLVISYLRFSLAQQGKGDSTRRQTDLADDWCEENGERLTDRLDDKGVSAFRGRNAHVGALSTFLELVQSGTVPHGSILLVEELDRLSRQEPEEALHLFLGIIRAGCIVVTLNTGDRFERGKIDTGKLMIAVVKFCTAHDESAKKSYRLAEAWKNKRAKIGERALTRQLPKWLKLEGGKVVVDAERVKPIRQAFDWVLEGYGTGVLVKMLNKQCKAIGRKPYFTRSYVAKILHSRAVIGEFQPHVIKYIDGKKTRKPIGKPLTDYYPAVVPVEDFDAVQAKLRKNRGSGGPNTDWVNIFKSLLYSDDGSRLQVQDKGYGRVFVSAGAIEGRENASAYVGMPANYFESATLYALANGNLDLTDSVSEQVTTLRAELDAVNAQFAAVAERKAEIEAALVTTGANAASLVGVLGKLDTQLGDLRTRRDDLQTQLRALTMDSPADSIKEMARMVKATSSGTLDDAERRQLRGLIARTVERITIATSRVANDGIATATATARLVTGQTIKYELTWRKTTKLIKLRVEERLPHFLWTEKGTSPAIYDAAQFWSRVDWHLELQRCGSRVKDLAAKVGIHWSKVYPHLKDE